MSPRVKFPSMSARDFKRLLRRELGYADVPGTQRGSHVSLDAPGRARIRWAFHDGRTLAPREIKDVLLRQAGLTLEEALEVVGNG